MRVLLVARYRHPTMFCKVTAIAEHGGVQVRAVVPANWKDLFLSSQPAAYANLHKDLVALPMLGDPSDPHRTLYRTCTFGMRAFKPHIVHVEEEPDSLAALQLALARRFFAPRSKFLLHTWQNLDRHKRPHVRAITHVTMSATQAIFCANQEAADLMSSWGYDRPTPIIPAIGVDTETFRPCPHRNATSFRIAFIGRLVPEKGIDTLLDALALLVAQQPTRPISLIVVGSGPHEQALRDQVANQQLHDCVQFRGAMDPDEIARQMCQFDVLVLPSRTTPVWKEQLGRVLLEAMACGIPVVGSHSGAIPEVIGDAGLLFPEGHASQLAVQLERLYANPALRQELRSKGLSRANLYSQKNLAHRTVAFYKKLLHMPV